MSRTQKKYNLRGEERKAESQDQSYWKGGHESSSMCARKLHYFLRIMESQGKSL